MGGAGTGWRHLEHSFGNIEDFLKMRKIYIYGFWGNGVFGAHI